MRILFSAVAIASLAIAAATGAQAQYRVKTRFPWVPQQGNTAPKGFKSATGSAHYNPKELPVVQQVPWKNAGQGQGSTLRTFRSPPRLGSGFRGR